MSKAFKTSEELATLVWIEAREKARAPMACKIKVTRLRDTWVATCDAPAIQDHPHFVATVARISARLSEQYDLPPG